MAGEQNGTVAILNLIDNGDNFIVGQIEMTSAMTGTAIDVSTKNDADFVKLMDGELAAKGANISVNIIYSSDAAFRKLRQAMIDATTYTYTFNMADGYGTVAFFGLVTSMADSLPTGDKVTSAMTILSLGTVLST